MADGDWPHADLDAVLSVGIELAYQVTCSRCGPLQGGLHRDIAGAVADRRRHIRTHEHAEEGPHAS
jgi:hypothetical protein